MGFPMGLNGLEPARGRVKADNRPRWKEGEGTRGCIDRGDKWDLVFYNGGGERGGPDSVL